MTLTIHEKLLQRTTSRPNAYFANGVAGYITIHMTGNRSAGADAAAHASWHFTSAPYSWHYSVDDKEAWQQLREDEQGWHAGDGGGQGNVNSIAIEIAMHEGIDQERAYANAVELVRMIISRGHGAKGVVQHNHWTGKDCPELIRHEQGRWEKFLAAVYEEEGEMTDEQVNALIEKFVGATFPQYIEAYFAGGFSARNGVVSELNPEGKSPVKPWLPDIAARVITIPGVTRE